ncbi:uncharacterized protein [Clytia hemisphaerica]
MAHGWRSEDEGDAPPMFTIAIVCIMVLIAIFFFVLFCYVYKKHSVARQQITNQIQQGVQPHFQQGNTMMNPAFHQYNTDGFAPPLTTLPNNNVMFAPPPGPPPGPPPSYNQNFMPQSAGQPTGLFQMNTKWI